MRFAAAAGCTSASAAEIRMNFNKVLVWMGEIIFLSPQKITR
jgi:hypothetical protein